MKSPRVSIHLARGFFFCVNSINILSKFRKNATITP